MPCASIAVVWHKRVSPFHSCPRGLASENAAFFEALRRSGNVNTAAAAIGRDPAMMRKRRARLPDFAAEWRAALVDAAARLYAARTKPTPEAWEETPRSAYRTTGGEPVIARARPRTPSVAAAGPTPASRANGGRR